MTKFKILLILLIVGFVTIGFGFVMLENQRVSEEFCKPKGFDGGERQFASNQINCYNHLSSCIGSQAACAEEKQYTYFDLRE